MTTENENDDLTTPDDTPDYATLIGPMLDTIHRMTAPDSRVANLALVEALCDTAHEITEAIADDFGLMRELGGVVEDLDQITGWLQELNDPKSENHIAMVGVVTDVTDGADETRDLPHEMEQLIGLVETLRHAPNCDAELLLDLGVLATLTRSAIEGKCVAPPRELAAQKTAQALASLGKA